MISLKLICKHSHFPLKILRKKLINVIPHWHLKMLSYNEQIHVRAQEIRPMKSKETVDIWGCEVDYNFFPPGCHTYNSSVVDLFASSTTLASNVILYCVFFMDLLIFLVSQGLTTLLKVKITQAREKNMGYDVPQMYQGKEGSISSPKPQSAISKDFY